jgi:phosphoribosylformimino-5-aminoimidazole carboxamide ribotide isomerase
VNGEAVRPSPRDFPELPIQIGGGIRDLATIEHYLRGRRAAT